MKTTRLEAFSDGVIAILITILVLEDQGHASSGRVRSVREDRWRAPAP